MVKQTKIFTSDGEFFPDNYETVYTITVVGAGGGCTYYESINGNKQVNTGGNGAVVKMSTKNFSCFKYKVFVGGSGESIATYGRNRQTPDGRPGAGGGGLSQVFSADDGDVFSGYGIQLIAGGGGGAANNSSGTYGGSGGNEDGSGNQGGGGGKGYPGAGGVGGSSSDRPGGNGGDFTANNNDGQDRSGSNKQGAGCGGGSATDLFNSTKDSPDWGIGRGGRNTDYSGGGRGGTHGGGQGGIDGLSGSFIYGGGGGGGYGGGMGGDWGSTLFLNPRSAGGGGAGGSGLVKYSLNREDFDVKYSTGPLNGYGRGGGATGPNGSFGEATGGCVIFEWDDGLPSASLTESKKSKNRRSVLSAKRKARNQR